jgi:ribosome-binding factor A
MANQRRVFKVGERIQGLIALELLRVADPRFSLVTITSVVVASDMKSAKVYWVVSGDKERREAVSEAFEGARGLFKRAIAQELKIRHVPNLKFFYDDTLDVVDEVGRLFANIKRSSDENEDEPHRS